MKTVLIYAGLFFFLYIVIKLLFELGNFLGEKTSKIADFFCKVVAIFSYFLLYCGGFLPLGIVWFLERRSVKRAVNAQKEEDREYYKQYAQKRYAYIFDSPEMARKRCELDIKRKKLYESANKNLTDEEINEMLDEIYDLEAELGISPGDEFLEE